MSRRVQKVCFLVKKSKKFLIKMSVFFLLDMSMMIPESIFSGGKSFLQTKKPGQATHVSSSLWETPLQHPSLLHHLNWISPATTQKKATEETKRTKAKTTQGSKLE